MKILALYKKGFIWQNKTITKKTDKYSSTNLDVVIHILKSVCPMEG